MLILVGWLSACTNSNNSSVVNNQSLQVQGNAELGVIEYGKVGSKTLLFTNNESSTLNLTPSLSGTNSNDFGLVQLNCTSVLPGRSCKVVVSFQSVGKLAGSYEASLTVGSQVIPVSASILSIPDPVVEIRVNGVVVNESLDLGTIQPGSARIFTVTVTNKGPIVAPGTITSSNSVYNKIYSQCDNISLKPNQSCTAKLYVQGQSTAGELSTSLSFGGYVTTVSLGNLPDSRGSDIQPISASLELGDITESGERLIKVIILTNNGDGIGGLNDLQLPPGYTYLHDNCGSLKPKQKCTLRVLYESNNQKGQQTGDITFNDSVVTSVVNRVDSLDNLATIEVSAVPSEVLSDSCQPITLTFKDAQGIGFILSQNLAFSLNLDFYSDDNCSVSKAKELPQFSYEVFGYVKMPANGQLLNVISEVNTVQGSSQIQVYGHLLASVVVDNLIAGQSTSLNITGGKIPYTVTSTGGVSVEDNIVSGLVSGNNSITVQDSFGQEVIVPITVSSDINLTAGGCSYDVPESVSCLLSISGGAGSLSLSTDKGTVDNLGNFTGQCINNLGSSLVTVEDEYGNSKELNLSYPCVYKTCSVLRAQGLGAVSGDYWLDPDGVMGGGTTSPVKVYCDFRVDGTYAVMAEKKAADGFYFPTYAINGGKPLGFYNYAGSANGTFSKDLKIFNPITEGIIRLEDGSYNYVMKWNGKTVIDEMNNFTYLSSSSLSTHIYTLNSTGFTAPSVGTSLSYTSRPVPAGSGAGEDQCGLSERNLTSPLGYPSFEVVVLNLSSGWSSIGSQNWCPYGLGAHGDLNYDGYAWLGANKTAAGTAIKVLYQDIYYFHPRTCQEAMDRGTLNSLGNTGNGTYTLDPDGYLFGSAPVATECDMETTPGTAWTGVAIANLNNTKLLTGKQFVKLKTALSNTGPGAGVQVVGLFAVGSSINHIIGKGTLNTTAGYVTASGSGYNYMGNDNYFYQNFNSLGMCTGNTGVQCGAVGPLMAGAVVFSNGIVSRINTITDGLAGETAYIYSTRYNYTLWERP